MRELANFVLILGTTVVLALHLLLALDISLAIYSLFAFGLAFLFAYLLPLSEGILTQKAEGVPWVLAQLEGVYWIAAIPLFCFSFSSALLRLGEAWVYGYAITMFIVALAGASLGFRFWQTTDGAKFARKWEWQDAPPDELAEQAVHRMHSLAIGVAAAIAVAVVVLIASVLFRLQLSAGDWLLLFAFGAPFLSFIAFRLEHLERSAIGEKGICYFDALHDSVSYCIPLKEIKEIALEEEGGKSLALARDRQGRRLVFAVHDARGFAGALKKKRIAVVKG